MPWVEFVPWVTEDISESWQCPAPCLRDVLRTCTWLLKPRDFIQHTVRFLTAPHSPSSLASTLPIPMSQNVYTCIWSPRPPHQLECIEL